MSKYGKYTGGQWEALGNILGGELVMDRILRGEVMVVIEQTKPARRMVTETCRQDGGSHCSLKNCHAHIADGDTICENGHEIGMEYEMPA